MIHTNITAHDLGLTMERKEREIFKWFLASYLFGRRVQRDVARQTWEVFMKHDIDSPKKITAHSYQQLVELLSEGEYRRHYETTARHILDMAQTLVRDYHGNLLNMYDGCTDENEFIDKLQRLKGVTTETIRLFMGEVKPVLVRTM